MPPLDQYPGSAHPDTKIAATRSLKALHATFIPDDRKSYSGLYTGARCQLPTGEVVEVHRRRTPFYDLCREIDKRGYGERRVQIFTPNGTPSLSCEVHGVAIVTAVRRD